jgi:hypothetical protein
MICCHGPAAGGSAPPPTPETPAQHAVAASETATRKRGKHIKEMCLSMSYFVPRGVTPQSFI